MLCSWPVFHADIREVLATGTFKGVPMGMVAEEGSRTRGGRLWTQEWQVMDLEAVIRLVSKRAEDEVSFLKEGLTEKVYSSTDVVMINNGRTILDLKSIMVKIKTFGANRISNLGWMGFKNSSVFFVENVLDAVGEYELRTQYREFNRRVSSLADQPGSELMSSIEILSKFLDPDQKLFKDVESILSILTRVAVMNVGVESVCESWVSVWEQHNSPVRGLLDQQRLEGEVLTSINGPDVAHCDSIVKEAMKSFWGKSKNVTHRGGHFVRTSDNIKSYTMSEAVDTKLKTTPKIPIMLD